MLNLVAVAAEAIELRAWLRRCAGERALDWGLQFARAAEWNRVLLHAVADGPGPGLAEGAARRAVEMIYEKGEAVSAVMSVGYCGALRSGLALGAVVSAVEVGDGERVWDAIPVEGMATGNVLSVDRFLGRPADKKAWGGKGFSVVEMEAAGVARVASEFGIAFRAVKVVTDLADEEFAMDFNLYRDTAGRFDRKKIAMAGLRHPIKYGPDLYRMATRGPRASETLGEALGKIRL